MVLADRPGLAQLNTFHILRLFTSAASPPVPPIIRHELAALILKATGGDFDRALALLHQARDTGATELLAQLKAKHGSDQARPSEERF